MTIFRSHGRVRGLPDSGCSAIPHLGNGVYVLTEEGQRYPNGYLDAVELRPNGQA